MFTSSNLPPCPFCSESPLRPCDRFEFIGLAGHFTGDWAQTPPHSSRQLPMYTNVIFSCTGWLIGTLTMSSYNHLQSAYRHATICGHDATEQTFCAIHVKSVSEKITCRYTSANKNKKTNMIFHTLVEMYSIALPTGRPPIYNRIYNKVAWTTQAKSGFGGTVFDGLATTKYSKPNRFWLKKTDLVWHFIESHRSVWNKTPQPLELGSSNLNIDHSSFCLKYRRMMHPGSRESQFLEQKICMVD